MTEALDASGIVNKINLGKRRTQYCTVCISALMHTVQYCVRRFPRLILFTIPLASSASVMVFVRVSASGGETVIFVEGRWHSCDDAFENDQYDRRCARWGGWRRAHYLAD